MKDRLLYAVFVGATLLASVCSVFASMSLLAGVLPRFLDGLLMIFVLPIGIPLLFAGLASPLERRWFRPSNHEENPLLLVAAVAGVTLFLPALLYSTRLLQDVDLLRHGVTPLASWEKDTVGWVNVDEDPPWEQRGESTSTTKTPKTGTTCNSLAVAVPARAGAGPERVWYCRVERCMSKRSEVYRQQIAASLKQEPRGGLVVRDAAERSDCDGAVARSSRAAVGKAERLYLTPGLPPEQLLQESRRNLELFFSAVVLLWVIFPALAMARSR